MVERKYQLLSESTKTIDGELRERVTTLKATFQSKFKEAVGAEVELRLRQMKELATVRGNVDVAEIEVCFKRLNFICIFCANILLLTRRIVLDVIQIIKMLWIT